MLDIEQLLDLEVPNSVRISPSGHQVIYSTTLPLGHQRGDNPVSTIWLAEIGKEKSARQLTSGSFNDVQPEWGPDGDSIAFISDRSKQGKTSAIYLLSLKGGEAYPLTPAGDEAGIQKFAWSPDGNSIAYLSPDEKTEEQKAKEEAKDDADVYGEDWKFNRLRLLHVYTKTVKTIVKIDAHIIDLGWKADGSALVFTHQETTDIASHHEDGVTLQHISLLDKKIQSLCRSKCSLRGGATGLDWVDSRIYFIAGFDPNENVASSTVYSVSDSQEGGEWKREASGETDCAQNILKVGDSLLIQVNCGLNDEIRDITGKVLFSEMTSFPTWHAVPSASGPILCIAKSTPSNPTEIFSVSADSSSSSKKPIQLSNHGHAFASPLGTVTPLSIPTADGTTTLDALFIAPTQPKSPSASTDGPHPTIVFIHGGPYFRATASFAPPYDWTPLLLSAGYAVLYPNYRGSSSRGAAFAACARGAMGTVDYDDVITTTTHCIDQKLADPTRLVVGGWSQGGFLSYLAAVRNASGAISPSAVRFRAAICGAGVTDWDTMTCTSDLPGFEAALAGGAPWLCDSKDNIRARGGSALWEFARAAKKASEDEVKGPRILPTLVLHGKEDLRVPVSQAWGWHRACRTWGVPCEMVVYPREGHMFKERAHYLDMFRRVSRFCDVHLSST